MEDAFARNLADVLNDSPYLAPEELQDTLMETFENAGLDPESLRVDTFKERALLTSNAGIVISAPGREYQITIVRSK